MPTNVQAKPQRIPFFFIDGNRADNGREEFAGLSACFGHRAKRTASSLAQRERDRARNADIIAGGLCLSPEGSLSTDLFFGRSLAGMQGRPRASLHLNDDEVFSYSSRFVFYSGGTQRAENRVTSPKIGYQMDNEDLQWLQHQPAGFLAQLRPGFLELFMDYLDKVREISSHFLRMALYHSSESSKRSRATPIVRF